MEPLKNQKLQEALPKVVFLLILLQPFLDILSFWMNRLELGNTLTLGLRFLMLAGFGLLGFLISNRKRAYCILAGVYCILLVGHVAACFQRGYRSPVYDLTNFIRVAQMPLFTLCMISCLRRNRRCYRAIEKGLIVNFWMITAALLISVISGTADPTYAESGYGIVGWFTFGNSQCAILSFLVPIVVTLSYRERNFTVFALTVIAGFSQLYLLGTRLAFLSIFVTAMGMMIVALLTKTFDKKYALVLILACAICAGTYKLSPMYLNQHQYETAMASKQNDTEAIIHKSEDQAQDEKLSRLKFVYHFYSPRMCMRFGADRVMEKYGYTPIVSKITATRQQKIIFCKMLMDEHPFISRVFGMELGRMQFHDYIYDVENDFHGVYFLFGAAGLCMMIMFIGYFLYLVIKALLSDFRRFFTIEAGAFGIALCLNLINAYMTAGVLRRPNASFYMSILLAVIYYLLKLRIYPSTHSDSQEQGV